MQPGIWTEETSIRIVDQMREKAGTTQMVPGEVETIKPLP
jgi:hypothetical protein